MIQLDVQIVEEQENNKEIIDNLDFMSYRIFYSSFYRNKLYYSYEQSIKFKIIKMKFIENLV